MQETDDPKNTRGGNNTAVSLGNNAALPLLMAGLQQSTITWLQCLQNSGAFLPHPVCKTKRPIPISRMGRSERKRFWGYDFGLEELEEEESEPPPEGVDTLPLTRDIGAAPAAAAWFVNSCPGLLHAGAVMSRVNVFHRCECHL